LFLIEPERILLIRFDLKDLGLVSIIIPTYNRAHLIGETLDSVIAQTHENWECILVDDGSTDDTEKIVFDYINRDTRIQYHQRPDYKMKGAPSCRNYGIEKVKGDYVMWLDDDDLIAENKIESQYHLIKGRKKAVSTCPWGRFTNNKDYYQKPYTHIYRDYNDPKMLLRDYGSGEFFPAHSFMISRDLIFESGLWNENLRNNEDAEFFCRVLINTKEIFFSVNTFVKYRTAIGNNVSLISNDRKASDNVKSWKLIFDHIKKANFKAREYLVFARKVCFVQLKEGRYRKQIFFNLFFFRSELLLEMRKRYRFFIKKHV
tara:strand:- start:14262 stop:15212 length:951 start_codon:yes stop_codon:yes gene_type:complete